jgi:hypothetical protein
MTTTDTVRGSMNKYRPCRHRSPSSSAKTTKPLPPKPNMIVLCTSLQPMQIEKTKKRMRKIRRHHCTNAY